MLYFITFPNTWWVGNGWEFQEIFDVEEEENEAIAVELFNDN